MNAGIEGRADAPSAADPAADAPRGRSVRNASYLAAASLLSYVFSFVFVLLATRILGAGLFGNYTEVMTYVGLFGILTDLGMNTLAVRDVMRDRSQSVRYVSNLMALRLLSSLLGIVILIALASRFVAPSLRGSVYIFALSLLPLAVSNTLLLVFQFTERLAYTAVFNVGTAAATNLLYLVALISGGHVLALVVVNLLVSTVGTGAIAWLVYARFLPRRFELDPTWWPLLLRQALPFVVLTVLNVVYSGVDMQLLYMLKGCGHAAAKVGCPPVGQYGIAIRLPNILLAVFVGSLNAALLPAFNRAGLESHDALVRLVRSACTLMLAIGPPIALLGSFFSREALLVVAGHQYLVAAPALSILMWAFPCYLILTMLYNALYVVHLQKVVMIAFAVTLVFNVVSNILLIPRYSYFGSAAVTVASELVNGAIVTVALRRSVGPLGLRGAFMKSGAVVLVAGVVLWLARPYGIVAGLPLGIVMLLLGLRLTHMLGPTEHDILARVPVFGRYAALL